MAAFTQISPDRISRFSDGSYGIYTAGNSLETAFREHAHHMGRFYADAGMRAAWISEVRQLIGAIDATLIDIRGSGFAALLDADDYAPAQAFAKAQKAASADGIVHPSVRHPGGQCIAAFWPDVVTPPIQGAHFRYNWDGALVSYVRNVSGDRAIYRLRASGRAASPEAPERNTPPSAWRRTRPSLWAADTLGCGVTQGRVPKGASSGHQQQSGSIIDDGDAESAGGPRPFRLDSAAAKAVTSSSVTLREATGTCRKSRPLRRAPRRDRRSPVDPPTRHRGGCNDRLDALGRHASPFWHRLFG